MPAPLRRRGQIEILQVLRGVAALMVVMFHARVYEAPSSDNLLTSWLFRSGAAGVDLFFCISGFVMVYTTRTPAAQKISVFAVKRLCRVVPTYTVATLLFVTVLTLVQDISGFHDRNYHFAPAAILRSLCFIPLDLADGSEIPLWGTASLRVGWTLNYEMYFYAVFALALLFGRLRWAAFFAWMGVTLCAIPLLGRGMMSWDAYHFYGWRFHYLNLMTSPLILEFVAGVVIGHLYLRGWRFPNREWAWLISALAVSLLVWALLSGFRTGFGPNRWGLECILALAALMFADNTVRFRPPAALVWLGNISFSLYLMHPLVVEGLGISLLQVQALRPFLTGLPYAVLLATLSIVCAYPMHRYVERGLSDRIREAVLALWRRRATTS
jgi:peptidoglycan/LPS O-acetylase OafA/YrhL